MLDAQRNSPSRMAGQRYGSRLTRTTTSLQPGRCALALQISTPPRILRTPRAESGSWSQIRCPTSRATSAIRCLVVSVRLPSLTTETGRISWLTIGVPWGTGHTCTCKRTRDSQLLRAVSRDTTLCWASCNPSRKNR
ncbi:hypothetical protein VTJ04DRAFT_836 [Mycothermus thermophilus]|uniref:uncharacterized protein n=1 Tax=Humicola insolens TaxID=85995 RepID=UPI0037426E14